jgi:hypothetical protein
MMCGGLAECRVSSLLTEERSKGGSPAAPHPTIYRIDPNEWKDKQLSP